VSYSDWFSDVYVRSLLGRRLGIVKVVHATDRPFVFLFLYEEIVIILPTMPSLIPHIYVCISLHTIIGQNN
jgi:hypothetical protein